MNINKNKTTTADSPGIGCALLHIIIPLIFWVGISIWNHYYPENKFDLENKSNSAQKIYFDKFVTEEYHPALKEKISRLDTISQNLNEILYFVDYQKRSLELQNKNLEDLIKEKKELEPIVASQKELVDAIFKVQEKRNATERTKDQVIGFVLGVVSSLVASAILFLSNRIRLKKIKSTNN